MATNEDETSQDLVGMSFKVPRELRQEIKVWAAQRDLTVTEVFRRGFEALKAAEGTGEDQLTLFSPPRGKRR